MKYRKTEPIDAEQFETINIWRATKAPEWQAAICECRVAYAEPGGGGSPLKYPHIHTLEGIHRVNDGDWIARGIKGEFWPTKPDIFAATYEPIPVTPDPPADPRMVPDAEGNFHGDVAIDSGRFIRSQPLRAPSAPCSRCGGSGKNKEER